MTALTPRRVAGATAILVLLFTMQAVLSVPAAGAEDTACQKVEDADLGVDGLQITVDGHVDVTFSDWVGTPNEYSAVTVVVTGLLAHEDLVWSIKAGSAHGDTMETNDGVISEDGTYTIGRAAVSIRAISHITVCLVETPTTTSSTTTTTSSTTTTTTTPTTTTPPTTDTTRPTVTTSTVTTPDVTVTTAAPEAEVLGTTITAPAEVTSDTLPFTGTNTGSMAVGGLVALLAGLLALRVSPRVIEEEGRWSDC